MARHRFARITGPDGHFNETCSVALANRLLRAGLLQSFDGKMKSGTPDEDEYFYTIHPEQEEEVYKRIAAAESE